ncbi:MAG: MFS transporter [Halioglobus sp.]
MTSCQALERFPDRAVDAQTTLTRPGRAVAVASVLGAMVLVVLNTVIANVALPTIGQSLSLPPAMSVWIIVSYQAALLMTLLPCAALGESLGYRRVFMWGVALFTGSSILCALSTSLDWLIAARFLQGLGGAAVMALGIALLRAVVAPRQFGAAIGWNALAVALSSAVGPTIGAAILAVANWPWLFAVNLPIGLLVLLAARALPDVSGTGRPLDGLSVLLNAAVFAAVIAGVKLLPATGTMGVALVLLAAVAMWLLVRREMPKTAPLIPLDLLSDEFYRMSVIASAVFFAGVTTGMVALPFYLQQGLGQDAWVTGLYMTPWPLTVAIAAPFAGHLAGRLSTARLCAVGGCCLATGLGASALWPLEGNPLPLIPLTVLCGLGFGVFNVANNRNMFLSSPTERSGAAGGMQATARLLGQTAGAVMMALLFSQVPVDTAPRIGLGIGAILTLMAGLASRLVGCMPTTVPDSGSPEREWTDPR